MAKAKALVLDIRTGKLNEKEIEVTPVEEPKPASIDLKELAQVIEDVKRIKEKLGLA